MKKLTPLTAVIFTAAILFCCLGTSFRAEGYSVDRGTATEYYGRAVLSKMKKAEELLYVYDAIVKGVEDASEVIRVKGEGMKGLTVAEFSEVLDAYSRDHAEHFWLKSSYSIVKSNERVLDYKPDYFFDGKSLEKARKSFDSRVNEILSGVDPTASDLEKELYIHDVLAESVEYVDGANAHNAYGAIVEGKAVCEGYAEAFQYLMQLCGVQSFLATGSSADPVTGEVVGHMWNYFKIGGRFYHTDITWNDQGNTVYHAYFNLTDEEIMLDHTFAAARYPLPICNTETFGYDRCVGAVIEYPSCSAQELGELLKKKGLAASVFVDGSVEEFVEWFMDSTVIREISDYADVDGGFRYGCSYLRNEVLLYIEPTCTHTDGDSDGYCDKCTFAVSPSLTDRGEISLPSQTDAETDIPEVSDLTEEIDTFVPPTVKGGNTLGTSMTLIFTVLAVNVGLAAVVTVIAVIVRKLRYR